MFDALIEVKLEKPIENKLLELVKGRYVVKNVLPYVIRKNLEKGENFVGIVTGKTRCQPKGSKVLMANGEWKNIEDVKIGDEVISPQKDGTNKFSKVIDTNTQKSENIYEVWNMRKNKKELLYRCADNHEIPFYNLRTKGHSKRIGRWELEERTAEALAKLEKTSHRRTTLSSFKIELFKNKDNCKIEPYTLGVFLGDGCSYYEEKEVINKNYKNMKRSDKKEYHKRLFRMLSITTESLEIMEEISKFYKIMHIQTKKNNNAKAYSFSVNSDLYKQIVIYGLEGKKSGNKFIPKEALHSDIDYRRKLLAGLIDTDGYHKKDGKSYSICTKSKQLAEDIQYLVYSLGGRSSIRKMKKRIKSINFEGEYYDVTVYIGKEIKNIPLLNQKKIRDNSIFWYKSSNRQAFELKKSDGGEVYGFTLDSPSHWYITDNWMITCNSGKSFSAMRIALEIDPNFTEENVVFSAQEFMELLHSGKLKAGSMIIWDEAGVGIATRDWYSILNKSINYVLQTWGHQSIGLLLTVPDFSFVDSQTRKLCNMYFKTIKLNRQRGFSTMKVYHLTPMDKAEMKRVRPRYTIAGKKLDIEFIHVKKPPAWLVNRYLAKKEAFTSKLNREVLFDIQQLEKSKEKESIKTISDEDMLAKAWNLLKDEIKIKNGKRTVNLYAIKRKLGITISRSNYVKDKLLERADIENYPLLDSDEFENELEEGNPIDRLNPKNLL